MKQFAPNQSADVVYVNDSPLPQKDNPPMSEKSFSNVFPHEAHAKLLAIGRPIDPHRYRAMFPERWSGFLRAHHRTAEEVAVFYDVTFRTAMNWWEGSHRPSGDKVALAATTNPEGFMHFMGAVA